MYIGTYLSKHSISGGWECKIYHKKSVSCPLRCPHLGEGGQIRTFLWNIFYCQLLSSKVHVMRCAWEHSSNDSTPLSSTSSQLPDLSNTSASVNRTLSQVDFEEEVNQVSSSTWPSTLYIELYLTCAYTNNHPKRCWEMHVFGQLFQISWCCFMFPLHCCLATLCWLTVLLMCPVCMWVQGRSNFSSSVDVIEQNITVHINESG